MTNSDLSLVEKFTQTNIYSQMLIRKFDDEFNKVLAGKDLLDDDGFENIKIYKKVLESHFKDYISMMFEFKKIPQQSTEFKYPISEDNFKNNILNVYAKFRDSMHNTINSKSIREN